MTEQRRLSLLSGTAFLTIAAGICAACLLAGEMPRKEPVAAVTGPAEPDLSRISVGDWPPPPGSKPYGDGKMIAPTGAIIYLPGSKAERDAKMEVYLGSIYSQSIVLPCGHKLGSRLYGGGSDEATCAEGHRFQSYHGTWFPAPLY